MENAPELRPAQRADGGLRRSHTGTKPRFETLLGRSKGLLAVLDKAARAALASSTALIQGETGTGKKLLARAVHALSAGRTKPFVTINCGAYPKTGWNPSSSGM